jgi:hypothetical protein
MPRAVAEGACNVNVRGGNAALHCRAALA